MTDSKTHQAAPRSLFARLVKSRELAPGGFGTASVGYSSVVSFRGPDESSVDDGMESNADDQAGTGLFVAHGSGLAPLDPVAHPRLKPRPEGAAKPLLLCEEPPRRYVSNGPASKPEVDIAAFVEVLSAAYPQPRDPDVRPVLKARPKEAARPFVFLSGTREGHVTGERTKPRTGDVEAVQQAHKERELKAFHEFLDRMESAPLEALDRPLADLDENAEVSRQFRVPAVPPAALYDPILEPVNHGTASVLTREAAPVPDEDRSLIVEAVIEPLDPVANPRLPHHPGTVLPGGLPHRLSPSQRAHLKRPVTLRDRHGRIAPVTYSLNPKAEGREG